MKVHSCDILIVGMGPAGSSAALAAAREGVRVLVLERRRKIGVPVRCAEHIPALLLGEINLGRQFVVQSVKGMRTFLPGGIMKETRAPGFMIRRDLFDQTLARASEEAGVQVLLSSRVLKRENGEVLFRENDHRLTRIRPKVIIGADGPHSTVGRWVGSINRNLIPAVQVRVPLVQPLAFTEIYFDREIYGGYGWLFPKGVEANVGIGMRPTRGGDLRLTTVLGRFLTRLVKEGKVRQDHLGQTAGWIPAEQLRSVTRENIMLVGDAAGHAHAMTGAGVPQAVMGGKMAGKWAARAVKKGEMDLLSEYEMEWRDLFGETLARAFSRRQLLEQKWDRLEEVIKTCWVTFREYYGATG